MRKQKPEKAGIDLLTAGLKSDDGMKRKKARKSLVDIGKPAIHGLSLILKNSKIEQERWEAAKALSEIDDPKVIIPLVKVLGDDNQDLAWLAAEGLIKFKKLAWMPILMRIMKYGSECLFLRQGAHHVFLNQKEKHFTGLLAVLVKTLDTNAAPGLSHAAARDMIQHMKAKV
jgi:hypothetical protein